MTDLVVYAIMKRAQEEPSLSDLGERVRGLEESVSRLEQGYAEVLLSEFLTPPVERSTTRMPEEAEVPSKVFPLRKVEKPVGASI